MKYYSESKVCNQLFYTVSDKLYRKYWRIIGFILLLFICNNQVSGQASDAVHVAKKLKLLLPNGKELPADKLDSLAQAWGKDRIMFMHNEEDDAKGIMHLVQVTDEMKQQFESKAQQDKDVLNAMLNAPAPDFDLADLQGKRWSLKDLRGKIVVLNFWFTSCTPCIAEMPELNKLNEHYRDKAVIFLGLTFNSVEQVSAFLKKYTFNYKLLPLSKEVDEKYHIGSWPTHIVIGRNGEIKFITQSGTKIKELLIAAIDNLK